MIIPFEPAIIDVQTYPKENIYFKIYTTLHCMLIKKKQLKICFLSAEGYGSAAVSPKPTQIPELYENIILVPLFLFHLTYLLLKYLLLKLDL